MKSIVGIFFFTGLFNPLLCQPITIFGESNQNPIPYAHILYYKGKQITGGTYSNQNGKARLALDKETDSIEISCLGYYSQKMAVSGIPSKIYLEKKNVFLEEVTISPKFQATIQYVGFSKERKTYSLSAVEGLQLVTHISNPYKEDKQIESFVFFIKKLKTDNSARLKIIFFQNNNGEPGAKIPIEPIIAMDSIRKRKIEVDLDSLNIMLPKEGLFAGIEWMGCIDEPDNVSKDCELAIMVNDRNEEILNQTFERAIFHTNMWNDPNKYSYKNNSTSMIPAFGFNVYD